MGKMFNNGAENGRGKISASLNTWNIWALIAGFAVADALGLTMAGIGIAPLALLGIVGRLAFLVLLAFIYTYYRPDVRIAALAHTMAATLSSMFVIALFSYMTVIWSGPLVDEHLVAFDQALGFHWKPAYDWVFARPLLYKGLTLAYCSILPQMIVLLFVLNFFGRIERCWEMIWLYLIACLLTMPFSVLWPAAGAYSYFHVLPDEPYVKVFTALRDGTFKTFGSDPILGVIQFPSLHAAAALIFAYVARGTKLLIPFLLLNIAMLVSTPFIGGHHLADTLGGVVLAVVTILLVRKAFAAGYRDVLGIIEVPKTDASAPPVSVAENTAKD
jgi:membrane-associated phospholipid phosphatase